MDGAYNQSLSVGIAKQDGIRFPINKCNDVNYKPNTLTRMRKSPRLNEGEGSMISQVEEKKPTNGRWYSKYTQ